MPELLPDVRQPVSTAVRACALLLIVTMLVLVGILLRPAAGYAISTDGPITVTISGALRVAHADVPAGQTSDNSGLAYFVDTGARPFTLLRGIGSQLGVAPNATVSVRGVAQPDGSLLVASSLDISVSAPPVTSRAALRSGQPQGRSVAPLAPRKLLTILVQFKGDTTPIPQTRQYLTNLVFGGASSVSGFYSEGSHGTSSFVGRQSQSGDVTDWLTADLNGASPCNTSDLQSIQDAAETAALAAGYDASLYDDVIIFMAHKCGSFAGLGWIGIPGALIGTSGMDDIGVPVHELGHNSGLQHAAMLICTTAGAPVSISATASDCTHDEYGDPYDDMGGGGDIGVSMFDGYSKAVLGWIPPASITTIQVPGTFTYTLHNSDVFPGTSIPQLIRVYRDHDPRHGGDPRYLYLDLRATNGMFSNWAHQSPATTGVSVRLGVDHRLASESAELLDSGLVRPLSFGDNRPFTLAAGATFVDPLTNVQITTNSVDAGTANVTVAVPSTWSDGGGNCTDIHDATNVTTTSTATTITLHWGAPICGMTPEAWGLEGPASAATFLPATPRSTVVSGLKPSTEYKLRLYALGGLSDNTYTKTSTGVAVDAITTAVGQAAADALPGKPGTPRLKSHTRTRIVVTWAAATGGGKVARYRIFRKSRSSKYTLIGYTAGGTHKFASGKLKRNTAYTFVVRAVDAAGHAGPFSTAARLRTRR